MTCAACAAVAARGRSDSGHLPPPANAGHSSAARRRLRRGGRSADESTRWYVVRADFPMDAWARIRDRDEEEAAEALGTEIFDELFGDAAAKTYVSPAPSSR